jgi:hypothetical protein
METTDTPGRHQGNQELRLRGPASARKQVDTVEGSTHSKTKKGKRPVWQEPVVEIPASLARMNVRRMKVMDECEGRM